MEKENIKLKEENIKLKEELQETKEHLKKYTTPSSYKKEYYEKNKDDINKINNIYKQNYNCKIVPESLKYL